LTVVDRAPVLTNPITLWPFDLIPENSTPKSVFYKKNKTCHQYKHTKVLLNHDESFTIEETAVKSTLFTPAYDILIESLLS